MVIGGCRWLDLTSRGVDDATEEAQVLTVSDRLARAGLSRERIAWWFAQEGGGVWVDGEPVTDPSTPAQPPTTVVLRG